MATVFITGGATGIGAATVRKFISAGDQVVVFDINTSAMNELMNEPDIGDVYFFKTDVRSSDSVIFVFLLCNSTIPELASLPATILQGIPIRSASLNFIPALSSLSSSSTST